MNSITKMSRNFMHGIFKFPQYALKVHKLISLEFTNTYFVGGAVRNSLLKKKVTDVDIATCATPKQVKRIFDANNILYDKSHEKFGIIIAKVGTHKIEVATFRTELYTKGRFPKVAFSSSAKIDSNRRDFTINALYYSPELKQILDFHKGTLDIKSRTLRLIGNPIKRILEDPLRIARAYRFAIEYNLKVDQKTNQAIKNNLHLLKKVSATRIQREINQISFAKRKKLQKTLEKVIHSNA